MSSSGITEQLAEWVVESRDEDVPDEGRAVVQRSVLDWLGCAIAGSREPASHIVSAVVEADGCTPLAAVVGRSVRSSSANAALANGVAGHVLDFDDSGAHPASYLTPTVLALGEELGASGGRVLTAWAVGYEVSSRLASGIRTDRPWHTTPLYGTLGATAAACALLELTTEATRHALGIAASQAGGVMRNFGTMTKAFHPGNAARAAIVGARLAARGFEADRDIVEARNGYADCFGSKRNRLAAVTEDLGHGWQVVRKPPAIKAWPTCSSNHPAITQIEVMFGAEKLAPERVASVIYVGAENPGSGSLQFLEPDTPMRAKFSLPYNIAAALIDGHVDIDTFSEERFNDDAIHELAARIELRQHAEARNASDRAPFTGAGTLRVALTDGTFRECQIQGRRTLAGDAVTAKFRANVERAALGLDAGAIADSVEGLRTADDLTEFVRAITVTP